MADINRTAKPAALWTSYDLEAFNIEIAAERNVQTFFGVSDLPVPQNISPIIWNNVEAPARTLSKTEKTFFAYIEDALLTPPGEWSLADDLALYLLALFGYDAGRNTVLQSQEDLWLPMCGSNVLAKTDGAVMERVGRQLYYTLLVQEDTYLYDNGGRNPEAQLVAQAIAAFRRNNRARDLDGLPALDSQTFPALIMFCTAPTFYFVTITKALVEAVQVGIYPQETTIVRKFTSPVPSAADTMVSVQNRRVLFQHFEAFKATLPPAIEEIKALAQFKKASSPWELTEGPHNHANVKTTNPRHDALVEVSNFDEARNTWTANTAPGNKVAFSPVVKNKQEALSNVQITISDNSDPLYPSSTSGVSASASTSASASAALAPPSATSLIATGSTFSTSRGPASPRVTTSSEALWTTSDLQAFNIEITAEHDIQTFFGVSELPVPQNISPVICNNVRAPAGSLSKTEKSFFAYMENALLTPMSGACHAVDFVRFLLGLFGYDDGPDRVLHSQKDIWFLMFGSKAYVKANVVIVERIGGLLYYNLLVQVDMRLYGTENCDCDPEAQLVAQAIAAFHSNNWVLNTVGETVLDSQTFLGIIISRTTPTFFLITVTKALSVAVYYGTRPEEITIVRKFVPPVELTDHAEDSMLSLQNRKTLLGYFQAFRQSLPFPPRK